MLNDDKRSIIYLQKRKYNFYKPVLKWEILGYYAKTQLSHGYDVKKQP